jgi:hypothetical protein
VAGEPVRLVGDDERRERVPAIRHGDDAGPDEAGQDCEPEQPGQRQPAQDDARHARAACQSLHLLIVTVEPVPVGSGLLKERR